MKRITSLCLLSFSTICLSSSGLYGQSADTVLAKMIEAQGGKETLESIEDRTVSGNMEMIQMGANGSVSMYQKKPNKMRMEFEMMGMMMTQAFDGQTAWAVNPQTGATQEMPEQAAESFKRQALGNEALLHPEKYGIEYTYKGTEKVKDKDCHLLEQSFSGGHKVTFYVDAGTYLPIMTKATDVNQMGAEVEAETYYSDYKKVDGIQVPHKISVFQDGQQFMIVTISEVDFNSGLEDSLFAMSSQ